MSHLDYLLSLELEFYDFFFFFLFLSLSFFTFLYHTESFFKKIKTRLSKNKYKKHFEFVIKYIKI